MLLLLSAPALAAYTWSIDGTPDSMTPEAFQAEIAAGVAMWVLTDSECGPVYFFEPEPVESGGDLQVVVGDLPDGIACDDSGCTLRVGKERPYGEITEAVEDNCQDIWPTRIYAGRAAGRTLGAEFFGDGELLVDSEAFSALMFFSMPCRLGVTANSVDLERLAYPEPIPTLDPAGQNLRLEEGEIATLSVQGPPLYNVAWFADGEPVGAGEAMEFGPLLDENLQVRAQVDYSHHLCGDMDTELGIQLIAPVDSPGFTEPGFGIPEERRGCSSTPGAHPVALGWLALCGVLLRRRRDR